MKKLALLLSLIVVTALNNISFAQKAFEGTITYGIEYEDLPEEMEPMRAMLPSETIIKIKGSKTRTEQSMGMGTSISIFDASNNTAISLIDMMGRKIAMKMDTEKENKEDLAKEDGLKIKYLDETKKIAGYNCKKAEISTEGEDEAIVIFYTEEINTQQTKSQYEGLKGFPMQYEISAQGLNMIMKVKEINKGSVSNAEFSIPKEYEVMTPEEFQQTMSGQMGE